MRACTDLSPLRIAVSFGVVSPRLAALLACQRAEEPQTPVRLHEVALAEQLNGLTHGRYDGGLALTDAPESPLRAHALWRDELAVAMPAQSPLRRFDAVPLEEVARYPLIGWQAPACQPVSALIDSLLLTQPRIQVQSYELMAVLILAGFGIGIGLQSRLAGFRAPHIVSRPLADCQPSITTYLLQPPCGAVAALDRLAKRGRELRQ
ncbi:LysR family substrate-binding domain-containing protein [Alcaligenes nematophilus]|uniref:LysR family substrate-binding domain-containing protein n=1 Tax=Alcaligenes nematophilus TaxID=2994643 RepID=UPI0034E07E1E